jgi:hydrogenase expression/formation protein HypD
MNFSEEFRNRKIVKALLSEIRKTINRKIRIMEVCGGHTMAIRRYGIHTLLPKEIELLSGPGCPVCVTDQQFIDISIAYARLPECILLIYGDMLRIPGTVSSLDREKAAGSDVRIIYSTTEALEISRKYPTKRIVFAAIGFETTVPGTAVALKQAKLECLTNFNVLCAHKTMPQAMETLIEEGIPIDGYIGPGHVSTIAGSKIFDSLAVKYKIPVVISGFEPVDLLYSVLMLIQMIQAGQWGVKIQYNRLVTHQGNTKAQRLVDEVFEPDTQNWRGIGEIPGSGLRIKKEFEEFDILKQLPIKVERGPEPKGCICGQILKGLKKPTDCSLFGKKCVPAHPVGACMVSSEGSCQAYFNFQSPEDTI